MWNVHHQRRWRRAVSACLTPVFRLDGTSVVTSEGLGGPKGKLHPIHEAFLAEQAFQCSFCTPGFVLATHALLSDIANPSESDIEDYLSGHICRCGSYANIRKAVLRASRPEDVRIRLERATHS